MQHSGRFLVGDWTSPQVVAEQTRAAGPSGSRLPSNPIPNWTPIPVSTSSPTTSARNFQEQTMPILNPMPISSTIPVSSMFPEAVLNDRLNVPIERFERINVPNERINVPNERMDVPIERFNVPINRPNIPALTTFLPSTPLLTNVGTITKFRGGEQNSKEWIQHFERVASVNAWNNEVKCLVLPGHLDEPIRKWVESLPDNLRNNWNLFKTKFLETYPVAEDRLHYHDQLAARKQRKRESIDQYTSEILSLCIKTNPEMSETDQKFYFMGGLLPEIKKVLQTKQPESLSKAIQLAKKVEQTFQNSEKQTKKTRKVSKRKPLEENSSESSEEESTDEEEKASEEKKKKSTKQVSEEKKGTEKKKKEKEELIETVRRIENFMKDNRQVQDKRKCFNCHKTGHIARYCRKGKMKDDKSTNRHRYHPYHERDTDRRRPQENQDRPRERDRPKELEKSRENMKKET